MSDDQTIIDSAERMERDNQQTLTATSERRNRTIRIIAVAAAIVVGVVQIFGLIVSASADCNARHLQDESNYQHSFAECEQRQGAGNRWRMQYVCCIENTGNSSRCEQLNPALIPTPSWF